EGPRAAAVKVAESAARWDVLRVDRRRAPGDAHPADQAEIAHQVEISERLERERDRVACARFRRDDELGGVGRSLARHERRVVGPVVTAESLPGEDDRVPFRKSGRLGERVAVRVEHALEDGQGDGNAAGSTQQSAAIETSTFHWTGSS